MQRSLKQSEHVFGNQPNEVQVLRPLATIVAAIMLSRPTIPLPEAQRYAKALQKEAIQHNFDPFTGVAIVHFETHWYPSLVSPDGEDYGLGQIRARYVGACRNDADPVHQPSEACKAVKASLQDGVRNIHVMATLISANRKLCLGKAGTDHFAHWLASYQGRNHPSRHEWCSPGDGTWRVVEYRKQLIRTLVKPSKPLRPNRKHTIGKSSLTKPNHEMPTSSSKKVDL
jgi:hypothetical protein